MDDHIRIHYSTLPGYGRKQGQSLAVEVQYFDYVLAFVFHHIWLPIFFMQLLLVKYFIKGVGEKVGWTQDLI